MKNYKFIMKYLKKYKFKIILAFTISFISVLISISYGYFNGRAVEEITNMNLKLSIIYFGICFLVEFFSYQIFGELGDYITNKTKLQIINDINLDTYYRVLNLESATFEEKTSGELINRITNDTESLSNTFNSVISMIIDAFCCLNCSF